MHMRMYTVVTIKCTQLLSSLSVDCLSEFVKSNFVHAAEGKFHPTAHTVIDCKNVCLDDDGCGGFDFRNSDNVCWLHTYANIRPLLPYTSLNNYKRTKSCKMSGMYSRNSVLRATDNSIDLRMYRSAISKTTQVNV